MPVIGLPNKQDQYMLDILVMDLPDHERVVRVRVELTWVTEGAFVAIAKVSHGDKFRRYSAHGDTVEDALLELAATIILRYPIEKNQVVDIGIPTAKIVNTKAFQKVFDAINEAIND